MRDYAEIAHNLRCCGVGVPCDDCTYQNDIAKCASLEGQAADAIEELQSELVTIRNQLPKWISVEEQLPDESGYTIVFCVDGDRTHVSFAKYQKTPKRWELTGARSYWRVLKWMPLPKAPKEDHE